MLGWVPMSPEAEKRYSPAECIGARKTPCEFDEANRIPVRRGRW